MFSSFIRAGAMLAVALIASLCWSASPASAAAAKTYTYSVGTKGIVDMSRDAFASVLTTIFADDRGWSLGGSVAFEQVGSGGDFTVILAQASQVPSFSSACSAEWSCAVGRNVIINNDRWMHGTALTRDYGMSVNDYRHLVVNHETGHYLGFGHSSCPGAGQPASVMQQQSKGGAHLGGCTPNAWPREDEKQAFAKRIGVTVVPAKPASVGIAARGNGGYWTTTTTGGVLAYGDATFHGSMSSVKLAAPVVGITAHPDGGGYWLVARDGGIFAFGSATFHGSMGGKPLNKSIVGMVATGSGNGYWLVAADGGVFAYGDAVFHGSMGGKPLNKPVVGISRSSTGLGYRLVASDGGIFSYGDATFYGSMGGQPLNSPVVGMASASTGGGYWMVASDGGIFAFGKATFHGSLASTSSAYPVAGMAARTDDSGYWLLRSNESITGFGAATSPS